jgi:hypothetical protein
VRIGITGKDKCFDWSKFDKFMQDALMAGIKAGSELKRDETELWGG